MKKPRIFINMHYMALGGAERALLGLLNALDTEKVDVDLFINQHTGEFMPLIPSKINLLPELKGYNAIERPMKTILKEGQIGVLYGRLKARFQHDKYKKSLEESKRSFDSSGFQYVANAVDPYLKSLDNLGEYDLAISFQIRLKQKRRLLGFIQIIRLCMLMQILSCLCGVDMIILPVYHQIAHEVF